MALISFPPAPADKVALEEGAAFTPRFGPDGLITAVATDAADGSLLKKGETSGNFQQVQEIRTDCDQDSVWLKVSVAGDETTCHTGRPSCFYRIVETDGASARLRND